MKYKSKKIFRCFQTFFETNNRSQKVNNTIEYLMDDAIKGFINKFFKKDIIFDKRKFCILQIS